MGNRLHLDGKQMQNPQQMHTYLWQKLHLPAHYGRTLDALFDCLTEIAEDTTLELTNVSGMVPRLWDVLLTAAEENPHLIITVPEEQKGE